MLTNIPHVQYKTNGKNRSCDFGGGAGCIAYYRDGPVSSDDNVPNAYFNPDNRQVRFNRDNPDNRNARSGFRLSMRVISEFVFNNINAH